MFVSYAHMIWYQVTLQAVEQAVFALEDKKKLPFRMAIIKFKLSNSFPIELNETNHFRISAFYYSPQLLFRVQVSWEVCRQFLRRSTRINLRLRISNEQCVSHVHVRCYTDSWWSACPAKGSADQIVFGSVAQFIHFETKIICNSDIIVLLRKIVKILKMWGSNKNWNIWCWIWMQTLKVDFM